MRSRSNLQSLLGILMFILIIVGATAAYIMYRNPDVEVIVFWAFMGVAILLAIGILFFGGVKLPQLRATSTRK